MRLGLLDEVDLFLLNEKQFRHDLCLALDWNLDPERVSGGGEHSADDWHLSKNRGCDVMPRLGHQVEASILARLPTRETNGVLAAREVFESHNALSPIVRCAVRRYVTKGLQ